MAEAPLVINNAVDGAPPAGSLFAGYKFFVVQRVPSRSRFVADIEANGGIVVKTEKTADYIIADHLRADVPGGSHSYTFIETALRNGQLPDPSKHTTGRPAGAVREVSSTVPAKSTRTAFTAEDDRILWQWVEREKVNGVGLKGNDIYKGLEAANPRHTFQSWRHRYVSRLMENPPAGAEFVVSANALPSPSLSGEKEREPTQSPRKRRKVDVNDRDNVLTTVTTKPTEQDEIKLLLKEAESIENVPADRSDEAWVAFANVYSHRNPDEWRRFYRDKVRPVYLAKLNNRNLGTEQDDSMDNNTAGLSNRRKRTLSQSPKSAAQEEASTSREAPAKTSQLKCSDHRKVRRLEVDPTSADDSLAMADNQYDEIEVVEVESSYDEANPETQRPDGNGHNVTSSKAQDLLERQVSMETGVATLNVPLAATAVDDEFLTSDANQAAEIQLRHEAGRVAGNKDMANKPTNGLVDGVSSRWAGHNLVHGSYAAFDTSDIDRDVEEQVQQEASLQQGVPSQKANAFVKPRPRDHYGRERNSTPSSTAAAAIEASNRAEAEAAARETAGFALTEANLAAQEAQLRQPVARGIDLPVDDDMQDQTPFASYLQQLVGVVQPPAGPDEEQELASDANREELIDDNGEEPLSSPFRIPGESTANKPLHIDVDEEQSFMSQEDVEEVLDSNMDWPSSPQRHKRRQIGLPRDRTRNPQSAQSPIPSDNNDVARPDLDFTGRSLLSQIDQPASQADRDDNPYVMSSPLDEKPHQANGDFDGTYSNPSEGVDVDGEESGAEDDADARDAYNGYVSDEEGLDLTIAEPDGGFSPDSSSGRSRRQPFDAHNQYSGPDTRVEPDDAAFDDVDNDVIDISSASLPSSSIGSPVLSDKGSDRSNTDFRQGRHAVETQDIFNAETPQPDFFMPLPPDTDDEDVEIAKRPPESRPNKKDSYSSRRQAQAQQTMIETEVETDARAQGEEGGALQDSEEQQSWIETMKIRGFEELSIIQALKCTTSHPDLAELVLVTEKSGKGFPDDVPGVWSKKEDEILESGNARGIKRLDAKHGWAECEARRKYLEEWREI